MAENEMLVGYCGLVCTNCGWYKKGKCEGCHSPRPANRNCKVKACAMGRGYQTCAECEQYPDPKDCRIFNNFVTKMFGLIFHTDRVGNIHRIQEVGLDRFKEERRKSGKA